MIRGIDPHSGPDDRQASPLAGLRVVELSDRVAGAYFGKLFVDAGADVVKVGEPGDRPLDLYLDAGKAVGNPDDLHGADIVVITETPGGAARLGVDADVVRAENPAAVLVAISPFGWTGPGAARPAGVGRRRRGGVRGRRVRRRRCAGGVAASGGHGGRRSRGRVAARVHDAGDAELRVAARAPDGPGGVR